MKTILAILFTVFFLSGSSPAQDTDKKDVPLKAKENVSITDPAQPIKIKEGRTFTIHLASNPTTGFKWQLAGPLDRSILTEAGHKYIRPASNLIGAGGKEIWKFKAIGKGKTVIEMEYVRPWEKNTEPAQRASFKITVSER
jgi:inhibitor of cysteine peptidase